ncbi:transcriptional regulator [Paenibacillus donghaensis]|uniref:Transcriptional regulator n=1 Tax=Paenibacillus donghaensis TaxID=414771 RepID=A0A2Z2KVQ8_9BACL|nr:transcriptional regulator [Paenibacillus donghaensis]ASA25391.1 transcriptional regulator [Paenibacillus donghaensis]
MNTYTEKLQQYIRDSKLSLSQICKLLQSKGLKTEKSYLSKLQNGKLAPASDMMNKALAEVLSVDPVELMAAAYREKIPAEVLERIRGSA